MKRLLLYLILMVVTCECGVVVRKSVQSVQAVKNSQLFHQGRHGKLTEEERRWANIAWLYFKRNTQGTGLVNSVETFPTSNMWQLADYICAMLAAHELEIIDVHELDRRLSKVLAFLSTMPLYENKLPNHSYHTKTGRMLNFESKPGKTGWSAIDLGRLLTWLYIAKTKMPHLAEYVDKAVLRWNYCEVIDDCGTLYGALHRDKKKKLFQEGRLGLEEYAARGFALWGFNTHLASAIEPFETVYVYGKALKIDGRDPRETGVQAPLGSLSFLLDGMEFNWDLALDNQSGSKRHTDPRMAEIAQTVYDVQELRYQKDRVHTARTDHQLKKKPYFVYDSIFSMGFAWNTTDDKGKFQRRGALVATKAVFGMWALWKTNYTDELIKVVACLGDPKRGWLEGRHERSGAWEDLVTLSTNASVLEALWYKQNGKLLQSIKYPGFYDVTHHEIFRSSSKCLPRDREVCP